MVTNVTREKVTAIVVCHGRDLSFLGTTLHGLSAQTHQPDRIVAVIPNHDSEAVQPIHEHLDTDSESVQLVAATGENLGQRSYARAEHIRRVEAVDWLSNRRRGDEENRPALRHFRRQCAEQANRAADQRLI